MKASCGSCGFKAVSVRAEQRIQELINRNRALENTIARITIERAEALTKLETLKSELCNDCGHTYDCHQPRCMGVHTNVDASQYFCRCPVFTPSGVYV